MARYEPVKFEKLTPEHKALYENVRGKRPKLVGPFSVLMHNPRARRGRQPGGRRGPQGRQARKASLRADRSHRGAQAWQAAYAWAVHDPLGRKAGLSGDVVDALQAERKPTFAKSDERAIYEAITELLDNKKISDGDLPELSIKEIGFDNALEAVACAGLYCMIGAVHQRLRGADAERRKAILTGTQFMFVKLSAAGNVTLEDRDNFRAFKLVVEGGPDRLDTPAARCPAPPNCRTRPPPGSSSRRCGSGPRSRRTPRGSAISAP